MMRRWLVQAASFIPRSRWLYLITRRYAFNYYGAHNYDFHTNGELHLLRTSLASLVKPIVFDVGANEGDWCAEVIKLHPNVQLHAFEPVSSTFNKLASRLGASVTLNQMAIGAERNTATIYLYKNLPSWNSLHHRIDLSATASEEVKVETLTHYCHEHQVEHIDFLKIDAEGNDFEVLKGATELFANRQITIAQFEYARSFNNVPYTLKDYITFMKPFPYDLYLLLPRKLLPIPVYHSELDLFGNGHFIFMLKI